ncbi:MAG: GTP-binding protein, partial [Thermosulfidibacteraceae bacterium]
MGSVENVRNIGLFGHATTGKTTLSEAILFTANAIPKMGSVEAGNTVMDFDDEEKERGNSINLGVARFNYKGKIVNLVDTPGYANFITDAFCALRAV